MVAGTPAAPNSASVCALMSSWWMGVYMAGDHFTTMSLPVVSQSRWYVSKPPLSPYDAFMRAMVTGRLYARAHERATASCAIFDIE